MSKIMKCLVLFTALPLIIISAAGCASSTSSSPPSDLPAFPVMIEMPGNKHEAFVDTQGRLISDVQLASADGKISLSIAKGTQLLDGDRTPLQYVKFVAAESLPLPPENAQIIGDVYELSPKGATAEPALRLTLSYDPGDIPGNVNESNVYIAPYDGDAGWGNWSYKKVDTENHCVTTQVNLFAHFAILAPLAPTPSQSINPTAGLNLASVPLAQALASGKPTLAEFGWRTCIPCKQMKPILEGLAAQYNGKLNVVIVEVYEQQELTRQHKIITIPTQIFFDAKGKEVARHMGYYSKEDIITQLKKMGIE